MALDMTLYRHSQSPNKEKIEIVASWIKANFIHEWFLEILGVAVKSYDHNRIEYGDLLTLLDKCNEVVQVTEQAIKEHAILGEYQLSDLIAKKLKKPEDQSHWNIFIKEIKNRFQYDEYSVSFLKQIIETKEMIESIIENEWKVELDENEEVWFSYYPIY